MTTIVAVRRSAFGRTWSRSDRPLTTRSRDRSPTLCGVQIRWKLTGVLPFRLIETTDFVPAMPSAIQMREDVAQLYSQIDLFKVVCRVHFVNQRRQVLLRVFKFIHESGPLDWRALFVYQWHSVVFLGIFRHFVRPLLAQAV